MAGMSVTSEVLPKGVLLAVEGQVDMHTSPDLRAKLRECLEKKANPILVDLTKVDSTIAAIRPVWKDVPDNYIGNARVEASDDLKSWRSVAGPAPLASLSQGRARLTGTPAECGPHGPAAARTGRTPARRSRMSGSRYSARIRSGRAETLSINAGSWEASGISIGGWGGRLLFVCPRNIGYG